MWEVSAPVLAWKAIKGRPWVVLIPLVWDAVKWGLSLLLAGTGFFFTRWDFTVGLRLGSGARGALLLPPPSLPSVEQLGVALGSRGPAAPTAVQIGVMLGVLAVDALVRGGFLHLLAESVRGGSPGVSEMPKGAFRYGWRLLLLALCWMGFYSSMATLVDQGSLPESALIPLSVLVIVLLWAAEFIMVANDVWPPVALLAAPILLWERLGPVLAVTACSAVLSGLLSGLGAWVGHTWLLAPVYAALGAWLAAAALAALSSEDPEPADELDGEFRPQPGGAD